MTQKQAIDVLLKSYSVKEVIKSKNCHFSSISKKLGVSEKTIREWSIGKSEPTTEQFNDLYKIKGSTACRYQKVEELMCAAFRHQYVPMAVLDGTITDPDVLYYYGL